MPEPGTMVAACARLFRGVHEVFVSTINRNLKFDLVAMNDAEYLL